ncbi:MAG TPA: ATP-binding protein [Methanocorpusculum sp.]|nr:ATP-binding protein [Methanocorpusculum sp.]
MTQEPDSLVNIDIPHTKRGVHSQKIHHLPPKLESFVTHVLINDEMPIENRFDLLAMGISALIGLFGIIFSFIKGYIPYSAILFAVLLALSLITLFLYVFCGWIKQSYLVHTVCNSFFFIPCFFCLLGGITSAPLPILILGVVWPLCFTSGKKSVVISVVSILIYALLILLDVSFPDAFPVLYQSTISQAAVNVIWALIVAVIISSILLVKSGLYEKQKKHIEAHESEMKTVMSSLKEADRAKNKFLANMSHEIRTPMNSIIGMNQLILRESADKNIQDYAAVIDHDSKGLLSIINEILDLSKISGGKLEFRHDSYDLRDVLMRCCSQIYPLILDKKLDCKTHVNPKTPSNLIGDTMRIQQILINLLSNAIKYTEKGLITFSLDYMMNSASSVSLKIAVSDTGIGISKENLPKIFAPFLRIDSEKSYIQGTGLGLSITKEIIEGMGGTIEVESTPEVGSTFTVLIPQEIQGDGVVGEFDPHITNMIEAAAREPDNASLSYAPLFVCPSLKILVVDDVASNLLVFRHLLKETKARIDTASSGAECLKRATESAYDIIFLDIMMPEMTGEETLQKLRYLPDNRSKDAPVIALTANALVGARQEYLQKGFTDYLSKPVEGHGLEVMIQKYVPKSAFAAPDVPEASETSEVPEAPSSEQSAAKSVPSAEIHPKLQKFTDISGLSPVLGLSYCGRDADTYYEVLGLFVSDNFLKRIETAFASEEWETYQTFMHTLKNTALTIGAKPLSEMAKALETAAAKKDTAAVTANHAQLMHTYSELLSGIKEASNEFSC